MSTDIKFFSVILYLLIFHLSLPCVSSAQPAWGSDGGRPADSKDCKPKGRPIYRVGDRCNQIKKKEDCERASETHSWEAQCEGTGCPAKYRNGFKSKVFDQVDCSWQGFGGRLGKCVRKGSPVGKNKLCRGRSNSPANENEDAQVFTRCDGIPAVCKEVQKFSCEVFYPSKPEDYTKENARGCLYGVVLMAHCEDAVKQCDVFNLPGRVQSREDVVRNLRLIEKSRTCLDCVALFKNYRSSDPQP